jgi:hypothetical protein
MRARPQATADARPRIPPDLDILEAMAHPDLWGPWFRDPTSWRSWRIFLSTLFALPINRLDRALYQQCTGRDALPSEPIFEAWLVCGRRSGKSRMLALIASYLAVFVDYSRYLAPGEIGTIKIIANDRKQARVIHRYCGEFLTQPAALAPLVARDGAEAIELVNGITIEIQTASFRSVRGYTVIAALCDEIAFWRSDDLSANPDQEIINALRPAMATIPTSMLLCASSPYARRGVMYDAYTRYYGQDGTVLVWHAETRIMNPTVSQRFIEQAYESDPQWAAAEYGAEFRTDLEAYISREALSSCVMPNTFELPLRLNTDYVAFVDPSGGSGDSMTIAIAHAEGERGVLDCIREVKPPFSPASVTEEFAELCGNYQITKVIGDRYGGQWPAESFQNNGIIYEPAEKTKSEYYVEFLPLINSKRVDLLDHTRGLAQLCSLERRTGRGTGRDIIDHPPRAHDDVANVIAGALVTVAGGDSRRTVVFKYLQAFAA